MRQMRQLWFVGDADELLDKVVGSGQRNKRNLISQDLENEKESRLKLCWLKEVIKEYDNTNN